MSCALSYASPSIHPCPKTRDVIQPLVVTSGKELNSKYGVYRHADLVGVPYGSKIRSRNGKGFIHLLRPTPELWTLALPHRTQILYLADIAFVVSWLDLKPGTKVIEAGPSLFPFRTHPPRPPIAVTINLALERDTRVSSRVCWNCALPEYCAASHLDCQIVVLLLVVWPSLHPLYLILEVICTRSVPHPTIGTLLCFIRSIADDAHFSVSG